MFVESLVLVPFQLILRLFFQIFFVLHNLTLNLRTFELPNVALRGVSILHFRATELVIKIAIVIIILFMLRCPRLMFNEGIAPLKLFV